MRGRRRDFDALQNMRQAQEFVSVAKKAGRRGGFEEGSKRYLFAWQAQGFLLFNVDV